jgi:L,D-peptidoglycan transpeptidase YkuD (ErfK/YbiS/YcfS/YnhG family)
MSGRRKAAVLASLLTCALALTAGCGPDKSSAGARSPAPSSSAAAVSSSASVVVSPSLPPSPSPSPSTSPSPSAVAPASPTATRSPTHAAPPPPPQPKPKPTPAKTPLLVEQLHTVGNAHQVITVTSSSWGANTATLQTFEKVGTTWRAVFPAMPAHLGRNGFSADKHEGDGKTPAGMYGFNIMFGQRANPGVKFPYRVADSQSVWVDDVSSPYYNTWQENAALKGEHLASSGYATAYAYAAVIAYNMPNPVPGKGSAIFLHVSTGGATAGCVSIAQSNLLQVLRWLDPAKGPVIVMGPSSVIRNY